MKTVTFTFKDEKTFKEFYPIIEEIKADLEDSPEMGELVETEDKISILVLKVSV